MGALYIHYVVGSGERVFSLLNEITVSGNREKTSDEYFKK